MLTDIVASLSTAVLSIFLTASLWRKRRVGCIHASLLGVMFTIIFMYSAIIYRGSVYTNYEAAGWAALVSYVVAAILATAEYRLRIAAWISRLWIRPREGYPPSSDDA